MDWFTKELRGSDFLIWAWQTWHSNTRTTHQICKSIHRISLWVSIQFHKTLFAKPNTHSSPCNTQTILTGINIMAKVFANVCFWDVFVIFWMQCFILQEMWGILCVQFLDLCVKVWKEEAKVWKCVLAVEKNGKIFVSSVLCVSCFRPLVSIYGYFHVLVKYDY